MSRYLTPAKISLLLVTLFHAEDVIPTKESIAVFAFLLSNIVPASKPATELEPSIDLDHALPISSFEAALAPLASARPGRTLYDLLVKRLWALDCSHALDHFITSLPNLLSKSREQILHERETGEELDQPFGRILRTSPLGAFIRRCHLEYTRLQFQDAITLWQDFVSYRMPTRPAFEKKNRADGTDSLDSNFKDLSLDLSHPLAQIMYGRLAEDEEKHHGAYSMYDVEKLMEFQVSELQRLGGRLPDGMKVKLQQMSKAGTVMPKLGHYLNFLDSWRAGDYYSAFDNLHRYFDYAMQTRERAFYQYALLNLAILQADFGCHAEALPAMQEAIATARENKDTTCLNFCMSWVYHFGRSFPGEMNAIRDSGILGSEVEGLAFLKSRAKDAEMWSLLSTTLLSEAKLGLQHGDSLAGVFENIAKASHLNIVKSSQSITGPTLLMRGAVFSRIGQSHMGWWCGQAFLQAHAKDAPLEDQLKSHCRLAGLLVQRGRYSEAEEMLSDVPPNVLRVLKFQNYLNFFSGIVKARQSLHRNNLGGAEYMLNRLQGQGAPDVELAFTLSQLKVELLVRKGDFCEALERVSEMAKSATKSGEINDIAVQTKVINLKARILIETDYPLKAFSLTVRAAQIAHRARLLPALWESIIYLATVLNELAEFAASIDLLDSILPQILETQDAELVARAYSVLADSYMGLAGLEQILDKPTSSKQKELVSRAMENIDQAYAHWRYVEDLSGQLGMLKLKARIMHWRGDLVLANDLATQYLELKKEYAARNV
jgi:anaphase-promoting complex subunit 5